MLCFWAVASKAVAAGAVAAGPDADAGVTLAAGAAGETTGAADAGVYSW